MPPPSRHDQEYLELPEDEISTEHLETQVQKAQEQLVSLKRQQDQIEKQKRELEELSRRQESLQAGRAEMVEKITRAMVVLEREAYDAQKRVELLQNIHDTFTAHQQNLEAINPKAWEGLDINRELTKALSAVDDARAEYSRTLPKISSQSEEGGDRVAESVGFQMDYSRPEAEKSFGYWLRSGFAFTLPLVLVGLLLVLIIYTMHSPVP